MKYLQKRNKLLLRGYPHMTNNISENTVIICEGDTSTPIIRDLSTQEKEARD
jgi:hypothetical protein